MKTIYVVVTIVDYDLFDLVAAFETKMAAEVFIAENGSDINREIRELELY